MSGILASERCRGKHIPLACLAVLLGNQRQECRHVIFHGAVSGRHSGAKKSYEARLGARVIVVEMSTLKSANNNVKEFTAARSISYCCLVPEFNHNTNPLSQPYNRMLVYISV